MRKPAYLVEKPAYLIGKISSCFAQIPQFSQKYFLPRLLEAKTGQNCQAGEYR